MAAVLCVVFLAGCDRFAPDFVPAPVTTLPASGTAAVLLPPSPTGGATAIAGTPSRAPTAATTPQPTVRTTSVPTAAGTPTPLQTPTQTFRYIVQADDTLSSIAAKFKTSTDMLVLLNSLPGDLIVVGQQLVIPGAPPTATYTPRPPTPTNTPRPTPRTYVVRLGDTLSAIAKRYGTTVTVLMQYNGLKSETLVPGQVLRIP
jgi:LysM repeat protein